MKTKKIIAVFFIILFLGTIINMYFSNTYATTQSIYKAYTNKGITLRQKASNSSTALEEVKFCQEVTVLSKQNGWVKIKVASGNIGYTMETKISTQKPYTAYTNKGITLRQKASNSSNALEEVAFCKKVTVIATQKNNWVKIRTASGNIGYTMATKISTLKPYVAYTNKGITLRQKASNSSNALEEVAFCKKVTVLDIQNNWVKIRTASGNIGYTMSTKTSTIKPYKAYTNKGISLKQKTSNSSATLEEVEFCKNVTVIGTQKNQWVKIRTASGNIGYTREYKLSIKKPYKNTKGYVKTVQVAYLRSSQDDNANIVTTVKAGEIVTVIAKSNGWYTVKTSNGTTGYIRTSYISTKNYNAAELLTTYTTYSNGSPSGRNYNMTRAASKITEMILKPGQEFNWANVVGPCNKSTGYKPATVIVGNSYQIGYGGGVCQVSTTLCGCIQKLKIKPTEKHKHTASVSYLNGDGVEAAVAYGYLNFRFTNTTSNTIQLEFYTKDGRVIVAAYKVK